MTFQTLGLATDLLRAVAEQGYSQPTPIQQQAIPVILQGRDILASAQTGTGKTAAFTLPLLQLLSTASFNKAGRFPRALILTPTRELAEQVSDSAKLYGKHLSLRSAAVYGGMSIVPQIQLLRRGVDILVATPGRLLDHLRQRTLDLSEVEVLVLDECDRMLDMGFIHDIRKVLAMLPLSRQTLMFSATFSQEIQQLAKTLLQSPALIEVAPRNTAAEQVTQIIHPVDRDRKRSLLAYMISFYNWRQVLVFTRTKHGANRLAEQLTQDGLKSTAIHGNKTQSARTRALNDFKQGKVRVLVATDVASRGLDIDQLPYVVNFDLPDVPEDYVHRIGRTGRAGNEGRAISLVCRDEYPLLKSIERLLNRTLDRDIIAGYEPTSPAQAGSDQSNRKQSHQSHGKQAQAKTASPKQAQATPGKGKSSGRREETPRKKASHKRLRTA